ncbi:hypothetical protein IW261DRAFT_1577661 [Armillaria novae-zelandiae]|uniref:SAP domain-containing protein n=1 Tax=Armillaria novae-zelandiae TaxID=153914 RepID=A0AA39KHT1_9AGAR|nr:hypothetical protein IW261DRAFT_1577661 [Armillaria novae-zelandiae]
MFFPCVDSDDPLKVLDEKGDFRRTEEIDISSGHLKAWYIDLCRRYRLPQSGNKTALRERLVKFSEAGKEKWKSSLLTPARISHKGVRSGSIVKRRKVTQLVHRMGPGASLSMSMPQGVPFPVKRSKDMRSQMKVDKLLPWAEKFMVQIAEEENRELELSHTHLQKQGASSINNHSPPPIDPFKNTAFAHHVASMVVEKLAARQNSSGDASPLPSTSCDTPCPSVDFDTTMLGLTAESAEAFSSDVDRPDSPTIMFEPTQTFVLPSPPLRTTSASPDRIQCSLSFANGETFVVRESDVPPTQPFCYNTDLPNLIRSWDDHGEDWDPPSNHPINVNGRPIPIIYWRDLYRFNRETGGEWKRLKDTWNNWRYFMEEYNASDTPEDFWTKFSKSGVRMSFSRIKTILLEERKLANKKMFEEAQRWYGNKFTNHFSYRRDQTVVPMTDIPSIVKLYKQKKGLGRSEDD